MTSVARHSFEDHTSEVRLCLEAPTLTALFEEAAAGLAELMLEVASEANDEPEQSVTVEARDCEALLVAWLNELVFLSETRRKVYTEVRVHSVSDTRLEASVRGVYPETLRTAVKAATLHGLRLEKSAHGYTAAVVLDV